MSNLIYPTSLIGLTFDVVRAPQWKTGVQQALSGKTSATAYMQFSLIHFELTYSILRDDFVRINLVPYSEDFTHCNPSAGVSITSNAVIAPDGTMNGDAIMYDGTGIAGAYRIAPSNPQTSDGLNLRNIPLTSSIWLRCSSGTVALLLNDNITTAPITVTTTWQRFILTSSAGQVSTPASVQVVLYSPIATNTPFMIYAWGVQQEIGLQATNYIPNYGANSVTSSDVKTLSGLFNYLQGRADTFLFRDPDYNTVTNQNFFTGDGVTTVVQLNTTYQASVYDPGNDEIVQNLDGSAAIFLARYGTSAYELLSNYPVTNLLLQSQAFATTWTASAVTATNNVYIAPDGTTTGTRILEQAAATTHTVAQSVTVPVSVEDITFSVFVLPNLTRAWCALQLLESSGSSNSYVYFNLTGNGLIGASPSTGAGWANLQYSIVPVNNGYYRVSVTATKITAATTVTATLYIATADNSSSYLGVITNGLTAWGAQLEINDHVQQIGRGPTAYLPTTTVPVTYIWYSTTPTNVITMTTAVPANKVLSWSGSFFYRCRFDSDQLDLSKFLNKWWMLKKIAFTSVKL